MLHSNGENHVFRIVSSLYSAHVLDLVWVFRIVKGKETARKLIGWSIARPASRAVRCQVRIRPDPRLTLCPSYRNVSLPPSYRNVFAADASPWWMGPCAGCERRTFLYYRHIARLYFDRISTMPWLRLDAMGLHPNPLPQVPLYLKSSQLTFTAGVCASLS